MAIERHYAATIGVTHTEFSIALSGSIVPRWAIPCRDRGTGIPGRQLEINGISIEWSDMATAAVAICPLPNMVCLTGRPWKLERGKRWGGPCIWEEDW